MKKKEEARRILIKVFGKITMICGRGVPSNKWTEADLRALASRAMDKNLSHLTPYEKELLECVDCHIDDLL